MTNFMITLQVRNNIRVKGAAFIRDIEEYTGAIVSNPKWLGSDYMCLTTGDPLFPIRMIRKDDVISSSIPVEYNQPKTDRNVFEAKGNKGNIYTIIREKSDWSCSCVGFGFRRDCRHVNAAKKLLDKAA